MTIDKGNYKVTWSGKIKWTLRDMLNLGSIMLYHIVLVFAVIVAFVFILEKLSG